MPTMPSSEEVVRATTFLINAYLWGVLIFGVSYVISVVTAIHCIRKEPTERKIAWLIGILAIPFAGWICYWIWRDEETETMMTYASTPIVPAPERDVAAAVSAALGAQGKSNRR